ncbi:MAG: beta-propeller fold lactonase family protein [Firmicutes bacterium]|nr:beta-propeller fold lactonase family protein [Bacillota bacterium]
MNINKNEHMLISDTGRDRITVMDIRTGSVVKNIYTFANSGPHGITVCENGQFLCFSNTFGNSVQIYDIKKDVLEKEICTGATPCHITGSGKKIYISNSDSDSVSVVDINEKSGMMVIPSGRMPHDVISLKDHVLIAESGSDSIGYINTEDDEYFERINLKCSPVHMCIIPGGKIIAAACTEYGMEVKGYICLLDADEMKLLERIRIGNCITDIAADPDGKHVYVTDAGNRSLYKVNIISGLPVKDMLLSGFVSSVYYDVKTNKLLVTDSMNDFIYIIDKEKWNVERTVRSGKDISHIVSI